MRSRLNSRQLHPAIRASGFVSLYAASTLITGLSPIAWAQNATLPVPAPNALPDVQAPAQAGMAKFEIEFENIPVTDLLIAIAKQGGVEISIQGDVDGTLRFVHYKSVTAEEAIERVAADAGLYWGHRGNQYIVTKSLADLPPDLQKPQKSWPNRTTPKVNTPGVQGDPFPVQGDWQTGITAPQSGGTAPNLSNFIPDLYEKKESKNKKINVIRVHNVPPRMMAYWLDPTHNPPDYQTQASDRNRQDAQDQRTLRPVAPQGTFSLLNNSQQANPYPYPYPGMMVSPGVRASPYVRSSNVINPYAMGSGSRGRQSVFNTFNNADIPTVSSDNGWNTVVQNGWGRPFVQARPQFGGGGFGGGNNNNGGGGFGGNNNGGGNGNGNGGQQIQSVFELPDGIDALAAVDAQNSLLIRGTAAAVEELQTIIDLLDQPLKQVEVEAQFVTLNTSAARAFGTSFTSANGPFTANGTTVQNIAGNFVLSYVGRNFQSQLSAALTDNRAKLITAPRVVAVNNLTASIFTQQTTTVLLPQAAINGNNNGNNVIATASVPFQIQTQIGISVTPTINGDGTITVLMRPQVQQQSLPPGADENAIPDVTSQFVDTVAIVRDGDTIALGGLRDKSVANDRNRIPILSSIPIFGRLFQSYNRTSRDSDLIIFLTARIVRRLNDDDLVPGT